MLTAEATAVATYEKFWSLPVNLIMTEMGNFSRESNLLEKSQKLVCMLQIQTIWNRGPNVFSQEKYKYDFGRIEDSEKSPLLSETVLPK